jgi:valyl-tRNA synthetase
MTQEIEYPKRFKFNDIQKKWIQYWREEKIYDFNIDQKGTLFSIDTVFQ